MNIEDQMLSDEEVLNYHSDGLKRVNPWLDGKTQLTVERLLVRALADHADWAGVDLHGGHYDPDEDPARAVSMADIVTALTIDEVRGVCIKLASWLASTIETLHKGDYGDDALWAAYQHMYDSLYTWEGTLFCVAPGAPVVVPKAFPTPRVAHLHKKSATTCQQQEKTEEES